MTTENTTTDDDPRAQLEYALADILGLAAVLQGLGEQHNDLGYLGSQLQGHYDDAQAAFMQLRRDDVVHRPERRTQATAPESVAAADVAPETPEAKLQRANHIAFEMEDTIGECRRLADVVEGLAETLDGEHKQGMFGELGRQIAKYLDALETARNEVWRLLPSRRQGAAQ